MLYGGTRCYIPDRCGGVQATKPTAVRPYCYAGGYCGHDDTHYDNSRTVVPLRLRAFRRRLWRCAPGHPITQYDHEYIDGFARRNLSRVYHEPEHSGGKPRDGGFSVCLAAHRGFACRHTIRCVLAAYGTGTCGQRRPGSGAGVVRGLQPHHTWSAPCAPREICLAVWFSRWCPGGCLQHQWPTCGYVWDTTPLVARIFSRHHAVLLLFHLLRHHCQPRCGETVDPLGVRAVPLGVAWHRYRDVFGWQSASYDPQAGVQPCDFWPLGGHRRALLAVKDPVMKPPGRPGVKRPIANVGVHGWQHSDEEADIYVGLEKNSCRGNIKFCILPASVE